MLQNYKMKSPAPAPPPPTKAQSESGFDRVNGSDILMYFNAVLYTLDEDKKWKAISNEYITVCLVDCKEFDDDLSNRYKLSFIQNRENIMELKIVSTTKIKRKDLFMRVQNDESIIGIRVTKDDVATSFHQKLMEISDAISPYAKVNKMRVQNAFGSVDSLVEPSSSIGLIENKKQADHTLQIHVQDEVISFTADSTMTLQDVITALHGLRKLDQEAFFTDQNLTTLSRSTLASSLRAVYVQVPVKAGRTEIDDQQAKTEKKTGKSTGKFGLFFNKTKVETKAKSPELRSEVKLDMDDEIWSGFLNLANLHAVELSNRHIVSLVEEFVIEKGGYLYLRQVNDQKMSPQLADDLNLLAGQIHALDLSATTGADPHEANEEVEDQLKFNNDNYIATQPNATATLDRHRRKKKPAPKPPQSIGGRQMSVDDTNFGYERICDIKAEVKAFNEKQVSITPPNKRRAPSAPLSISGTVNTNSPVETKKSPPLFVPPPPPDIPPSDEETPLSPVDALTSVSNKDADSIFNKRLDMKSSDIQVNVTADDKKDVMEDLKDDPNTHKHNKTERELIKSDLQKSPAVKHVSNDLTRSEPTSTSIESAGSDDDTVTETLAACSTSAVESSASSVKNEELRTKERDLDVSNRTKSNNNKTIAPNVIVSVEKSVVPASNLESVDFKSNNEDPKSVDLKKEITNKEHASTNNGVPEVLPIMSEVTPVSQLPISSSINAPALDAAALLGALFTQNQMNSTPEQQQLIQQEILKLQYQIIQNQQMLLAAGVLNTHAAPSQVSVSEQPLQHKTPVSNLQNFPPSLPVITTISPAVTCSETTPVSLISKSNKLEATSVSTASSSAVSLPSVVTQTTLASSFTTLPEEKQNNKNQERTCKIPPVRAKKPPSGLYAKLKAKTGASNNKVDLNTMVSPPVTTSANENSVDVTKQNNLDHTAVETVPKPSSPVVLAEQKIPAVLSTPLTLKNASVVENIESDAVSIPSKNTNSALAEKASENKLMSTHNHDDEDPSTHSIVDVNNTYSLPIVASRQMSFDTADKAKIITVDPESPQMQAVLSIDVGDTKEVPDSTKSNLTSHVSAEELTLIAEKSVIVTGNNKDFGNHQFNRGDSNDILDIDQTAEVRSDQLQKLAKDDEEVPEFKKSMVQEKLKKKEKCYDPTAVVVFPKEKTQGNISSNVVSTKSQPNNCDIKPYNPDSIVVFPDNQKNVIEPIRIGFNPNSVGVSANVSKVNKQISRNSPNVIDVPGNKIRSTETNGESQVFITSNQSMNTTREPSGSCLNSVHNKSETIEKAREFNQSQELQHQKISINVAEGAKSSIEADDESLRDKLLKNIEMHGSPDFNTMSEISEAVPKQMNTSAAAGSREMVPSGKAYVARNTQLVESQSSNISTHVNSPSASKAPQQSIKSVPVKKEYVYNISSLKMSAQNDRDQGVGKQTVYHKKSIEETYPPAVEKKAPTVKPKPKVKPLFGRTNTWSNEKFRENTNDTEKPIIFEANNNNNGLNDDCTLIRPSEIFLARSQSLKSKPPKTLPKSVSRNQDTEEQNSSGTEVERNIKPSELFGVSKTLPRQFKTSDCNLITTNVDLRSKTS